MEPTAVWGPYGFQVANWSVDGAAAAVLPVTGEYTSVDIFGTCCSLQQAHVPESIGGLQQVVDEYYSVDLLQHSRLHSGVHEASCDSKSKLGISSGEHEASRGDGTRGVIRVEPVSPSKNDHSGMLEQEESEFMVDIGQMKQKMHRYPASLRDSINKSYTVPRIVAIGPYFSYKHSNLDIDKKGQLKQAEDVKRLAVLQWARKWSHSEEQLHAIVDPAADDARRLYDKNVMAGIDRHDFRHMMLYDACFLVQFMYMYSRLDKEVEETSELERFLRSKRDDFLHDLTLLENQLPWQVVEPVMRLGDVSPKDFVKKLRNWLQDHKTPRPERSPFVWNGLYEPPHLLALLRYYTVGRSARDIICTCKHKPDRRSVSTGVRELEKIGIKLAPNKTAELIHMGVTHEGFLYGNLSLAPLSLDHNRASHLVNMAALELCTVERFSDKPQEDTAVCSYLRLLAMMAYKVEDVHELREKGLLQGGGGLTDEDALRFFSSLQGLRLGRRYIGVMQQIERFKKRRSERTRFNAFWYDNKKTMAAVLGFAVSVATIVGTLVSIKTAL